MRRLPTSLEREALKISKKERVVDKLLFTQDSPMIVYHVRVPHRFCLRRHGKRTSKITTSHHAPREINSRGTRSGVSSRSYPPLPDWQDKSDAAHAIVDYRCTVVALNLQTERRTSTLLRNGVPLLRAILLAGGLLMWRVIRFKRERLAGIGVAAKFSSVSA